MGTWLVRSPLQSLANGLHFTKALDTYLFRIGLLLFIGASYTMFGRPLANMWLLETAAVPTFESSPVMLGIVGAFLMLFSRMTNEGGRMQDEVDRFI